MASRDQEDKPYVGRKYLQATVPGPWECVNRCDPVSQVIGTRVDLTVTESFGFSPPESGIGA